jgi:hypothetical protein
MRRSPRRLGVWKYRRLKGAFYFEGDAIIAHQYVIGVQSAGNYEILLEVFTVLLAERFEST